MTNVVEEAISARKKEYKEKHGETVTKEDYNSYKESFSSDSMSKPLSFTDYKDIASFYGKRLANDADLSIIAKAGIDVDKYRKEKQASGKQDYRKGGMVLSTVDNRKNK
tara:strand:+ start:93 stop:419 length:327 start_codon:yes stop_codon:yes gene_type:complete